MASNSLASLIVKLQADSAQYKETLKSARKQLGDFGRGAQVSLATIAKASTGILAAAGAGFVVLAKRAIDNADNIGKMSQKLGIATDKLSEMQFAAKMADVDVAGLQTGLRKLAISAADVKQGSEKTIAAFEAIGISAEEVSNLPLDQLFRRVAEQISKYADSGDKAAVVNQLLGRTGLALVPLLNTGAKGFDDAAAAARKYNQTVGPEAAQAADDFNDNIDLMKLRLQGAVSQAVLPMLKNLNDMTDALTKSDTSTGAFAATVDLLATALKAALTVGIAVDDTFSTLGNMIGSRAAQIAAVLRGDLAQARFIGQEAAKDREAGTQASIDAIKKLWADGAAAADKDQKKLIGAGQGALKPQIKFQPPPGATGGRDLIQSLRDEAANLGKTRAQVELYKLAKEKLKPEQMAEAKALLATIEAYEKNQEAIERSTSASKTAADAARQRTEEIAGSVAALREEAATIGMSAAQIELRGLALAGATPAQLAEAAALRATIDAAATAAERETELTQIYASRADLLTGIDSASQDYARAIDDLNALLGAGRIKQDEYNAAIGRADDELKKAGEEADKTEKKLSKFGERAAENIQDSFANFLFDPFKDGMGGMVDGFAAALRRMAADALAAALLEKLFKGSGGLGGFIDGIFGGGSGGAGGGIGAAIGDFFGGFFAHGGDLSAGKWGIVGENGPELISGGTSGKTITPMESIGRTVNQYININAPDPNAFRASERQIRRSLRLSM